MSLTQIIKKCMYLFIYLASRLTQFYLVCNTSLNPDEYYPINPVFLCSITVSHERSCRCKWQMIIFWDSHLSWSHRHSQTLAFTDVTLYWKSRFKGPTFLPVFKSLTCHPALHWSSLAQLIFKKKTKNSFNLWNSTVKLNFTLSIKLNVSPFCMSHGALPLLHFLSPAPWHTCGVSVWVLVCLWAFAVSLVLHGFTYELKPLKENTSNPFFLSLSLASCSPSPLFFFFNSYPFIMWPQ